MRHCSKSFINISSFNPAHKPTRGTITVLILQLRQLSLRLKQVTGGNMIGGRVLFFCMAQKTSLRRGLEICGLKEVGE